MQSVPSGATLVLDGAIVGTTPAMFPQPKSGSRTLELRLDGYQRESLLINADTQSVLEIPLRKRDGAPRSRPSSRVAQPAQPRSRSQAAAHDERSRRSLGELRDGLQRR